jgi:threonine aldolase
MKAEEQYMEAALAEAQKAFDCGEVPIGAVMVRNGEIIARGHNLRNTLKNPLRHAEIDVIHQSAEIVGDWRLEDCVLYVTVEPCPMCAGAIVQARIPKVVFGTRNQKAGCAGSILDMFHEPRFNHQVEIEEGILQEECAEILKRFFHRFRKKAEPKGLTVSDTKLVASVKDKTMGGNAMYSFTNDYSEGAHERIMEVMLRTNRQQTCGYGEDEVCAEARSLILKHLNHPSDIHFLVGGTQTNFTFISSVLRPHQGVISTEVGHINVHESGAVEATGHKVLVVPSKDGKMTAEAVESCIQAHYNDNSAEHMVQPGMVYISSPTEVGTIYHKAELEKLQAVCRKYGIPLFLDGARLGCALTAEGNDVTLQDLARLTDAFYIGGTKMGALFGEALVINNPALNKDFRYILKQKGGMLAKGRLLGIQFGELFRDTLYFDLAKHANAMARKLEKGISELGYSFLVESPTNQIFPIFPKEVLSYIQEDFSVTYWEEIDATKDAVRLCTSWATEEAMVDAFLEKLRNFGK